MRDKIDWLIEIADDLPYMDFCRWVRAVYWNLRERVHPFLPLLEIIFEKHAVRNGICANFAKGTRFRRYLTACRTIKVVPRAVFFFYNMIICKTR